MLAGHCRLTLGVAVECAPAASARTGIRAASDRLAGIAAADAAKLAAAGSIAIESGRIEAARHGAVGV
jgi:hypothetical protein